MTGSLLVAVACVGIAVPACKPATVGTDSQDVPDSGAEVSGEPTWHQDIAPILAAHCGACHSGDAALSVPFDDGEVAAAFSGSIAAQVAAGAMPPWGAQDTDECAPPLPWQGDLRLSDEDAARIVAWHDAGAPLGDAATAQALPDSPAVGLDGVTHSFSPSAGYTPPTDRDEYRCFVIDPELGIDTWVEGIQVEPGDTRVVHHALVYSDPLRQSTALADDTDSYECFGDPGFDAYELLGIWTPGATPLVPPDGAATPLKSGGLLVVQVHYFPLADGTAEDLTTVHMRLSESPPAHESEFLLLGNYRYGFGFGGLVSGPGDSSDTPEFRIPAGASDHTETMFISGSAYTEVLRIWAVGAHMHLAGSEQRIWLEHGASEDDEDAQTCLLHEPSWDFDWQRMYSYETDLEGAPALTPDDTLWWQCTYDNTLDNPQLAEALAAEGLDAPVDLELGASTLDEMCLAMVGVVREAP